MNTRHLTLPALAAGLVLGLAPEPRAADPTDPGLAMPPDPLQAMQRLGHGVVLRGNALDADPRVGPQRADHDTAGHDTGRPDAHAPIGVMGDHLHGEGEWMVSLRAMKMRMDGLRDGTNRTDTARGYMVSPIDMDMNMLMLGGMYAPSDELTLMVMLPYITNEMDHVVNPTGVRFTTRSRGFGDTRVTGLVRLAESDRTRAHLNLGLSIPTGSITEEDRTPASAGADVQLPFPMQLGSGTWDVIPGVTVTGQEGDESWGAQASYRVHLGENSQGYSRGDRLEATAWWAHRFSDENSASIRVAVADWQEHSDLDDDVPNAAPPIFRTGMVPTADPDLQDGQRVDLFLGWNGLGRPGTWWEGHRFAIEAGAPVRQALSGPMLETDWILSFGWQKAF